MAQRTRMAVQGEGFAAFVEQEYDRLRRALVLYCGDAEVAAELAQDTFARVYQRWTQVQRMERPAAWAYTVAFNLARSTFRRRGAERRAYGRHGPEPTASTPDPAGDLAVREAIAALPPRQREAIVHRYFLGRSVAETSAILGIADGAVRAATFKAIQKLRAEFDVPEEVADRA